MHEIGDTPRFAFTDKATPKAMINRPDRNTTLRFSILFVLIGIKATDALVLTAKLPNIACGGGVSWKSFI